MRMIACRPPTVASESTEKKSKRPLGFGSKSAVLILSFHAFQVLKLFSSAHIRSSG
jgi:hypothetical protein